MTEPRTRKDQDEPTPERIAAAAAGDRSAQDALLRYGLPELQRFLGRRMGPLLRSLETSADLAQSVCGEVLQDLGEFQDRGKGTFRRWLFARAEHKILKRCRFHRQEKRDARRREELPRASAEFRLGAADPSPSRHAIATEEWQRFRAALAALPEDYREVILLSRVAGLTPEQVAEKMGRTRAAVWTLLSRALARLAVDAEGKG